MPDPFEILRWVIEGLYEVYKDPALLIDFARSFGLTFAFMAPTLGAIGGLRFYAKRHGREFPDGLIALSNSRAPFIDRRLNEPFELIRRARPFAIAVLLVGGVVAGIVLHSMMVYAGFWLLASFAIVSKRLYVEACIAFGAKPVLARERVDTPAPLAGT